MSSFNFIIFLPPILILSFLSILQYFRRFVKDFKSDFKWKPNIPVIIAILAAVLVPTVTGYIGKAKKSAAQSELKNMCTAVQAAATDSINTEGSITADSETLVSNAKEYGLDKTSASSIKAYIIIDGGTGAVVSAMYTDGSYKAEYRNSKYTAAKGTVASTDATGVATKSQVVVKVENTAVTLENGTK